MKAKYVIVIVLSFFSVATISQDCNVNRGNIDYCCGRDEEFIDNNRGEYIVIKDRSKALKWIECCKRNSYTSHLSMCDDVLKKWEEGTEAYNRYLSQNQQKQKQRRQQETAEGDRSASEQAERDRIQRELEQRRWKIYEQYKTPVIDYTGAVIFTKFIEKEHNLFYSDNTTNSSLDFDSPSGVGRYIRNVGTSYKETPPTESVLGIDVKKAGVAPAEPDLSEWEKHLLRGKDEKGWFYYKCLICFSEKNKVYVVLKNAVTNAMNFPSVIKDVIKTNENIIGSTTNRLEGLLNTFSGDLNSESGQKMNDAFNNMQPGFKKDVSSNYESLGKKYVKQLVTSVTGIDLP